jgi:hypothetical protein
MNKEFINDVNISTNGWFVQDPYYYIRIDSIDHDTIDFTTFTAFTPSDKTKTVKTSAHEYFAWIGPANGVSSITFTKTHSFPSTDKYLFEIMVWGNQRSTGNLDLSVGGSSIWTQSAYQTWNDYGKIIRIPITEIESGSKSVVVTVPANCMVGWLRISRLTRFEGGKEYNGPSETRIDALDAKFTQNGITEIDKMDLTIAMKPEYYDYNGFNILKFDLGDHITLTLGESMDETVPMFGGYIEGWDISQDGTELTLSCVSRIWDLKRTHVLKNFTLGGTKLGQDGALSPYTNFASIQEAARYLCTSLYDIDYSAITRDYAYFNNFSTASDVTGITSVGFDTRWETGFGTNGSAMTIRPTKPGVNSLILYSDINGTNWDATVYPLFEFQYYVSGAGVKYPIKFNLEIDMFMTNQTPSDASTYVFQFNGPTPTGSKRLVTTIKPLFNGKWQKFSANLDDWFGKKAPASASVTDPSKANYYITEIRIVGQQDNLTVLDRRCSSLTLDNIIGYRTFDKHISTSTADAPTAFDELQEICDKSNYMAWIRPGMERSEDQLIFLPKNFYVLPIQLTESNIKELTNLSYHPLEGGLLNYVRGLFEYQEKRIGTVTQANFDSIKHYLPIGETNFLSGMTSLDNANEAAQKRLDIKNAALEKTFNAREDAIKAKNKTYKERTYVPLTWLNYTTQELKVIDDQVDYLLKQNIGTAQTGFIGFDVTMQGSTLLEPGQYVIVSYPPKRVEGAYVIESIEHTIDFVGDIFETTLNLNVPSMTFRNYKSTIDKLEKRMKKLETNAAYNSSASLLASQNTSRGAYS